MPLPNLDAYHTSTKLFAKPHGLVFCDFSCAKPMLCTFWATSQIHLDWSVFKEVQGEHTKCRCSWNTNQREGMKDACFSSFVEATKIEAKSNDIEWCLKYRAEGAIPFTKFHLFNLFPSSTPSARRPCTERLSPPCLEQETKIGKWPKDTHPPLEGIFEIFRKPTECTKTG